MSLETRTTQEIYDLIIDQIEAQIGQTNPWLPKSFIRVITKIFSGVGIIMYKVAGWIFLQIFVSTASYKPVTILGKTVTPLIEWGKLIGVGEPDPATTAVLEVDLTVLNFPNTLLAGTQFISSLNGIIYITQDDYSLTGASETVEITAVTSGEIGNLDVGDTLSLANDIGFIESEVTVSAVVTEGTDVESESSYRQKVSDRFKLQPQGGALADYRIWSATVPGVKQTYIYTGDIPTHVIVYVAGDDPPYTDRIPSSGLLDLVGAAIDLNENDLATQRPVTAIIDPAGDLSYGNIVPITVKNFEVNVNNLDVDASIVNAVLDQIEAALTEYFLGREPYIRGLSRPPAKNVVSLANVYGIVNDIVNSHDGSFLSVSLTSESLSTPLYVLGEGELCKLNDFTSS